MMNELPCVEVETGSGSVSASIIWLHGLGADGRDFVPVVSALNLPDALAIRFIFSQAPARPITINSGYVMPAWYDIVDMNIERTVDELQLRESAAAVQSLIAREVQRGVAAERIILAGFSQGGAVVYEAGLGFAQRLAGLLILSSYCATFDSLVIHPHNQHTPILIQHGSDDAVVPEVLGQKAYRFLADKGCHPSYESYPMEHTLCDEQIASISRWIQTLLT